LEELNAAVAPTGLKREHVLKTLADLDAGIDHPFGKATGYENEVRLADALNADEEESSDCWPDTSLSGFDNATIPD